MNNNLHLEPGDRVVLTSGDVITILNEDEYVGSDANNKVIEFTEDKIFGINKSSIKVEGGDDENYWMFYTGPGYKDRTPIHIAYYAKYCFAAFKDMSVDEIIRQHIYWGTESSSFHSYYNGDTYVLYDNINALPEDKKLDAEWAREHR